VPEPFAAVDPDVDLHTVGEVWTGRRLLRPFLGVGVLGGFTTFSAYVVEIRQATAAGAARTALLYLTATLIGALVAVWAGTSDVLGFLTGLPADPALMAAAGTGFCGALTTNSTFSYETLRLARDGAHFRALANVIASVVAGLGAGYLGLATAHTITS
jgi:fluoride ion exporter CrcB/FEX